MRLYAAALVAVCGVVFLSDVPSASVLWQGVFWMPLIAAAQMTRITALPEVDMDTSLASIVIAAAAILLPPQAVVAFTFVGLLSPQELNGQASLAMALFNRSQFALSGAAAAAVVGVIPGAGPLRLVAAALVASLVFELANDGFMTLMFMIRRGYSFRRAVRSNANPFPRFAANEAVSTTLTLLLVVLVRDVGWWAVPPLAAPLWLSHSAQQSAREAQDRAEELAARVRELEMLNRLSTDLLSTRSAGEVEKVAETVLEASGEFGDVALEMNGADRAPSLARVPIVGAEPAAIVVSKQIDGPTRTGLEAAASLIGLTWTRLALEAELAETERARTALTEQILEEGTRERSRIAMSVHDDVLPLFAAAQMQIDTADMLVEMNDLDRAGETIEKATSGVNEGIRALRDTLEDLRQSTVVPGTMAEGVRKLLADLQARTGIRGTVDAPSPLPDLPFAVELLAYETIRGCLANVEKHSQATKVQVELRPREGTLEVLMHDDGRGFDATRVGTRSHGLALMRQRAELARGSFEISGAPGAGTSVRLEVPTW